MEPAWTVESDGKQYGPFTTAQLMARARSGEIRPGFLVRNHGGPAIECGQILGLFDEAPETAEPMAHQRTTGASSSPGRQENLKPAAVARPNRTPAPEAERPTLDAAAATDPARPEYALQRVLTAQLVPEAGSARPQGPLGRRRKSVAAVVGAAALLLCIHFVATADRAPPLDSADDPSAVSAPAADAGAEFVNIRSPAVSSQGPAAADPSRTGTEPSATATQSAGGSAGEPNGIPPFAMVHPAEPRAPGRLNLVVLPPTPAVTGSLTDSLGSAAPLAADSPPQTSAAAGSPALASNNPPSAVSASAAVDAGDWLKQLNSICVRRTQLINARADAEGDLKKAVNDADAHLRNIRQLDLSIRAYRNQLASVEQQILRLSQFVARDPTNIPYQSSLDFERTLQTQITSSITKAGADQLRMKGEYDAMQVEMAPLKDRVADVYRDADRLRSEFMAHLSPFGVVSTERAAIGVEYFTQQMAEAQDNQAVRSFALFGRACSHLLGGDSIRAVADLDEALRAAPKDPLFLTIRGVARVRSGDFEAGRKDLAEAVRTDEHDYFARFHFALALCRIDAYVTIEQELKDAMKLAPSSPAPFALIALIKATGHDGIRNPEYALRTAQTAYDMTATKTWDAALALAAAYADKGHFDEAIRHAEEALSAARAGRQAEWCRSALKTFEAGQPLRIDWKTFDFWELW